MNCISSSLPTRSSRRNCRCCKLQSVNERRRRNLWHKRTLEDLQRLRNLFRLLLLRSNVPIVVEQILLNGVSDLAGLEISAMLVVCDGRKPHAHRDRRVRLQRAPLRVPTLIWNLPSNSDPPLLQLWDRLQEADLYPSTACRTWISCDERQKIL